VDVYNEMLREAALAHTTEEWMRLGEENRIAIMRANTLDEVLEDPHLKAVDFFQLRDHATEGKWRAMKPPVKFSKTPSSIRSDPPRLGQDDKIVK
jgi:crotonobetainyl-CoA:carnitine CoA-transferase CaiB-like acyl-CoA transferase